MSLRQQAMAIKVKITDQRYRYAQNLQSFLDMRNGGGSIAVIDGNAHNFRSGTRQIRHLIDGAVDIGGIGIGHGLHHDWRVTTHRNATDINRLPVRVPRRGSGRCTRYRFRNWGGTIFRGHGGLTGAVIGVR